MSTFSEDAKRMVFLFPELKELNGWSIWESAELLDLLRLGCCWDAPLKEVSLRKPELFSH